MPLRSVQTVRIVKLYKPLSQIRSENILSVLNEMQFTDRIRTEKCLYDLYRPYGLFSDRISLSILDMSGNVVVIAFFQILRCSSQTKYYLLTVEINR